MARLFYFADLPGLAVSTQKEMAEKAGMTSASAAWTDSPKSFPAQRSRLLKALRPKHHDEVWVASLPVLAANRSDLRYVINALTEVGASILEGATGWQSHPPYEEGLKFANCYEYWGKRRKLLDDPRGTGRATRMGAKDRKMPAAEARMIWLDPTISTNAEALTRMNSDPRYRKEWTQRTAYKDFGPASRPPGARPKPAKPEPV